MKKGPITPEEIRGILETYRLTGQEFIERINAYCGEEILKTDNARVTVSRLASGERRASPPLSWIIKQAFK